MHKFGFWKLAAPCLLIIAAALVTVSIAGDGTADLVLGQANFTYNAVNFPSARKLFYPQGVAIDASGNLYVADVQNSRCWAGRMGRRPMAPRPTWSLVSRTLTRLPATVAA